MNSFHCGVTIKNHSRNLSTSLLLTKKIEGMWPFSLIIHFTGSFFKNPVVKKDKLEWIKKYFNDVPSYKLDDKNYKIPAAWLIESAGLKGKELDGFGIHKTQPLVLVNYGGAKGEDIYKLSLSIKEIIFKIFKIELETEVNII